MYDRFKRALMTLLLATTAGLAACGAEEESADDEAAAETTAAPEVAAEPAPSEEAAPATTTRSCALRTHCREYLSLPYTMAGEPGAPPREITLAMIEAECSSREGTLAEGPCDTTGMIGSCTQEHMIWHHREGANVEQEQRLCEGLRQGTWTTN